MIFNSLSKLYQLNSKVGRKWRLPSSCLVRDLVVRFPRELAIEISS